MVDSRRWQKPNWLLVLAGILMLVATSGWLLYLFFLRSSPGTPPDSARQRPVKIFISSQGLVEVGLDELAEYGFKFPVDKVENVELTNSGDSIPYWIATVNGKPVLRFYGRESSSRYSKSNVYWLGEVNLESDTFKPEREEKISNRGSDLIGFVPPMSYPAVTRIEQNLIYEPLVREGDHWFWTKLTAPAEWSVEAELKSLISSTGILRLRVWGKSEGSGDVDHHLRVLVNNQLIADKEWDGKGEQLIQAKIPDGALQEGGNPIRIESPGDTESVADVMYIDWIELEYPRRFVAEDDKITFLSPGGLISLEGFSGNVDIYDTTDPLRPELLLAASRPESEYRFTAGREYTIVGENGYAHPDRIETAIIEPDLTSNNNSVDYVIIAPDGLLDSLEPLMVWRRNQGLSVMAIPLQAVYDQFNYGLPEPKAIQSFVDFTYKKWSGAPKYLLLIGDATYDPYGYISPTLDNQLPTFFVDTIFGGETASDRGFVNQTSPDLRALKPIDLAIGRIPARNKKEVTIFIEKTIAYEKKLLENPSEAWQKHIVAIADDEDTGFVTDAQEYLKLFPMDYSTQLIDHNTSAEPVNQAIRDQFSLGSKIIAYFGHGAVNMWGRASLFSQADIAGLENGDRLPIVVNFTCLTGMFTYPRISSLAEGLLFQPGGGAVAVLAPSSLTLPDDQFWFGKNLTESYLEGSEVRFGDILARVYEQAKYGPQGTEDILETFIFFGDPGLLVR